MSKQPSHYIKNLLMPCIAFSVVTGAVSAVLIALFRWATERVIACSTQIFEFVRENPSWFPCLVLGASAIGLIASVILTFSRTCRGGGIPSSIAAIRGITNFKWLASIFLLPISALLTFFCGVPLGTEGPCVQMGTAVGDGAVRLFGGKNHAGWRRYVMTGGATAGFSLATGAPVTAILFSMEELHHRFSPLLFSVASLSVIAGQTTAQILAHLGLGAPGLFSVGQLQAMPYHLLLIPLILGLLCGGISVLFTKLYHRMDKFMRITLKSISVKIKFPIIFACIAAIGFFISEILGTGHSLTDHLFEARSIWYILLIVFLVRAVFMMLSNTAGVTGGIFLPTLAFGAMIGSLCAEAFITLGIIGVEYYKLLVVLGMVAFLGANSRIPVTACVFAIEALSGIQNVLPIIVAVTAAFLMVEVSGLEDFTDTVIETKAHSIHAGKTSHLIEVPLTVYENSFVVGKELSDILWPVSCVVLSMERGPHHNGKSGLAAGDVLTVHYTTYDPVVTAEEFEVLVGDQTEAIDRIMRPV